MPESINKLYHRCVKALTKYVSVPDAHERALNLCLVLAGIRPACLWYIDPDYEESIKFLNTVQTEEVQYVIGLGEVEVHVHDTDERQEIAAPHTLILRTDNQAALKLINSKTFEKNIFASHKKMGESLGYICAGDERDARYHIQLRALNVEARVPFIVIEQVCHEKHSKEFQAFAQAVQDFVDENRLPIVLDLVTITRK